MVLLGIEMPFEEFDRLMCEQASGKELKVINNEVVAVKHEVTEEETKQLRIAEIREELTNLSQDFIQTELGAIFDDLDTRKERFKSLHNELRELLGKEPREYITEEHEGEE